MGKSCLEQRPLTETVRKCDEKLEINGDVGAYRRKLERVHAKEFAYQTRAESAKFIANDTSKRVCRPSECELHEAEVSTKVLGARMETNSESCSRDKLSGDVFDTQWGKGISDYKLTEGTSGYDGLKSEFVVAEGPESSIFRRDKIKLLESNSLENKPLYLPTKATDALFRDSGNFLLAKESNNQNTVPYRVDLDRIKVSRALNLFDDVYRRLLQQLETKTQLEIKKAGQIPVEAAMIAKQQLKWFNTNERVLGDVPGIKVGDQFCFQAQLALIGLHCQHTSCIDYMQKDGKIFATSIVDTGRYFSEKASDHYPSETESPDVFLYSGQGGNPLVGSGTCNKRPEDQKLEGGNLALKNSMEARIPVRVIRKRQTVQASSSSAKSGNTPAFLYDGLYVVSNCIQERGPYGKLIFKFQFNRIHGQSELTRRLLSASSKLEVHHDCYVADDDISQGKEKLPIRALNTHDNEKPPRFVYITKMVCSEKLDYMISRGCDCINGCSDIEPCSCLIKNGGEIPFNENGAILKVKSIVYECGPSCKCPCSCKNRVSQHGVQYQLEIFKTESKGWGVRSHNFIARGSFICEYAGELLSEKEAEKRTDNDEYLFDIGNNGAPEESMGHPHPQSSFSKPTEDYGFTIDAAEYGNVGRFVNHCCSPNLYAQDVLYDHDDKKKPHVMLFASKNVPPLQELTFDYNYKIDQVRDANGNIKKKNCYCGARNCIGRMY